MEGGFKGLDFQKKITVLRIMLWSYAQGEQSTSKALMLTYCMIWEIDNLQ